MGTCGVTKLRSFRHDARVDAKSAMKLLALILDIVLRVAAGVTVLVFCALALFVGGMAGLFGLIAIALPAIAMSAWVCSVLSAHAPSHGYCRTRSHGVLL